MNILFLVGAAIFLGTISGKIFQRFKIPQVVGYILLGLVIGKSFLHLFEGDTVKSLNPLVNFTLGIIGCVIGSELKSDVFKKFGKSIYTILFAEGILSFVLVAGIVTLVTDKLYLGLILGAIASATDPASTINVLWEYKAKGPVTRTVTSIIALDDGLALIIYGLVSVFSKTMILKGTFSVWEGLCLPILEIGECVLLGMVSAALVIRMCKHIKEEALLVSFVLGVIAAGVGLSMYLQLDLILSSMAFGATIANVLPKVSEKLFGQIREMSTSLYILFFVSIGAQLDIHIFLNPTILWIVIAYLVARSGGKVFGAMLGGLISKADPKVTRFAGICLFTQGGVAMGLALSINHNLSQLGAEGQQVGLLVINVVAATTFVVQLIGPPLVKFGISKADEINRNVTKQDVIDSLTVGEVMNPQFVSILEGENLNSVITTFREEDHMNYPVVDKDGILHGIITIKELKNALYEEDLSDIIFAEDVAAPSKFNLLADQPLSEAYDIFDKRNIDFLPVLDHKDSMKIVGIISLHALNAEINKRLLERHRETKEDVELQTI